MFVIPKLWYSKCGRQNVVEEISYNKCDINVDKCDTKLTLEVHHIKLNLQIKPSKLKN